MRARLVAACLLAWACRGGAPGPDAQVAKGNEPPPAEPFAAWEHARLVELASADPRLESRTRVALGEADSQRPVLGAILREDPGLRVVGGRADVFSFDSRARELDRIAAEVRERTRADAPHAEATRDAEELELLARFVAEERARVDEERALPGSASALVRGVVATWSAPGTLDALHERDAWLAARLDEILASMSAASLRAVEVTELEDALDPLERLAEPAGFPKAEAALARLRVALGAAHAASGVGMGWPALHARLVVHLGVAEGEADLRDEIARSEKLLRDAAKAAVAALPEPEARAALASGVGPWLSDAACAPLPTSSIAGVRGFTPPPERLAVCAALGSLSSPRSPAAAAAALVAEHDAVALAGAALAMHTAGLDPDRAAITLHLMADHPPEGPERLVRFAAVRPVACLAVARMARILLGGGAPQAQGDRAARWLAAGDAPLDVVLGRTGP
jgi:hypothetical protein